MDLLESTGKHPIITRSSSPMRESKSYGGSGGVNFRYAFGQTITKIETYSSNMVLYGLGFTFDDGTVVTIGKTDKTRASIDLTNDSITAMYVLVTSNSIFGSDANHYGCGGLYIKTLKGLTFVSYDAKSTPATSKDWQLVLDQNNIPCSNYYLTGIYGASGSAIDALGFYYENDVLLSRVVRKVSYSNLKPGSASKPINVASAVISNHTSEPQEAAISFSESVTSSYTWSAQAGLKVGLETTVQAGVPFVVNGTVSVSTEFSFAYTWGATKSLSRVFSYNATIKVPSNKTVVAKAIATTYDVSGSFSATYVENWAHAGVVTQKVSGSISGVSAYNVSVSYEEQPASLQQTLVLPEPALAELAAPEPEPSAPGSPELALTN